VQKKQLITQLTLIGVVTFSTLMLTACNPGKHPNFVACNGVSKNNMPINMLAGTCKKLADSKATPLKCDNWQETNNSYICRDPGSNITVVRYPQSDYVKCYGIVAANMNDCGTATTACGGSVHVNRQKDAWIAIPNGICKQIKGSTSKLQTTDTP
jgi:hypothetical protein